MGYGLPPDQTVAKKVVVTDDNWNMLYEAAPGNMTRELYERYLERLAQTEADIIAVDMAIPDLCFYKSQVSEWWGQYPEEYPVPASWNVFHNFKSLIEAGEDPGEILVSTLHRQGRTVVAGVRTNDCYGHPQLRTRWEKQHPQWLIPDSSFFDYAIAEVREHRLAIVQEILQNYDVDGIQLDFTRNIRVLSSPDKADLLTDFVRRVRDLVNEAAARKGKKMLLGAILAWEMKVLDDHGIDYEAWIKEGLLDYVIASERSFADGNVRVRPWTKLVEGTQCEVYPSLHGDVGDETVGSGTDRVPARAYLTMPQIRAAAVNFYDQGADGIAFYNFYQSYHDTKYPLLKQLRDPAALGSYDRHYFSCRLTRFGKGGWLRIRLEPQADPHERKTFRFYVGEKLSKDTATLAFKARGMAPDDELVVDINGTEIPAENWTLPDPLELIQIPTGIETRMSGSTFFYWRTPISTPPLRVGYNKISFRRTKTSFLSQKITIAEIEILVKGDLP